MTRTDLVRRGIFAATLVANLVLVYWPRTAATGGVPHLDKVAHLLAFAALAWAGLRAGVAARWILPVLALHAGVSELVQHRVMAGRTGDLADVVADLVGTVVGAGLARASWRDERAPAPCGH